MLSKLADKVVQTSKLPGAVEAEVEKPTVAAKILGAKDGNKSVLVEKLGGFLTSHDKAMYDGTNDQTAKTFLVAKGLKPSGSELAAELLKIENFKENIKVEANAQDNTFQAAVKKAILEPFLDIPAGDDTSLSWDW